MAENRIIPYEVYNTEGTLTNGDQIRIEDNQLPNVSAPNAQLLASELERLWAIVNAIEATNTQISDRPLVIFNDSFVITSANYAAHIGKNNVYAAKVDKDVTVTLPAEADVISYPVDIEVQHFGGTARVVRSSGFLTNRVTVRTAAGEELRLDTESGSILTNGNIMLQGDTAVYTKRAAGTPWVAKEFTIPISNTILPSGVWTLQSNVITIQQFVPGVFSLGGFPVLSVPQVGNAFTIGGDVSLGFDSDFGAPLRPGDVIVAKVPNPSRVLNAENDDWLIIRDAQNLPISLVELRFLSQVSEMDMRLTMGDVNQLGAEGLVWLSPVIMDNAPFLIPTDDPNNPRPNANGEYYIGGRTNRTTQGAFQFGANRFNHFMYLGITPSYISNGDPNTIDIIVIADGQEVQRFNLATDFILLNHSDFSNATVNHYIYTGGSGNPVTFNYPSLAEVAIVQTITQRTFAISPALDVTSNVNELPESRLSQDVRDILNRVKALPINQEPDFSPIFDRLSPLVQIQNTIPYVGTYFNVSNLLNNFPEVSELTQVSAANPRFQSITTHAFVFVEAGGNYAVRNITQSQQFALDDSQENVDVRASVQIDNATYFGYVITGLVANDFLEIERIHVNTVVKWENDIENLQGDITRIDAQLDHAALNLPDEVINVLTNEISVDEESDPSLVATPYNIALGPGAQQKVFPEPNANTPSSGTLTSRPFSELSGDQINRKLIYFDNGNIFGNSVIVWAYDGTTQHDLLTYRGGNIFASVNVPAVPSSTITDTLYPAPDNRVSGAGIWHNIPTLTTVNGVPTPEADELFFTRNLPNTPTTLTVQYRGHANGNIFGSGQVTLPNVGGNSQVATTFVLDDGSESAMVEVRYFPNFNGVGEAIKVSVTESIRSGLPTINDIEVILSYEAVKTVPATPAATRLVNISHIGTNTATVFAIKPSASNTAIIVGDQIEIDTGYSYTTLFGAGLSGTLTIATENGIFFNYEDFEPIANTIQDLENHGVLTHYGLFSTEYTQNTIVSVGAQLEALDNLGNTHNVFSLVQEVGAVTVKAEIVSLGSTYRLEFTEL